VSSSQDHPGNGATPPDAPMAPGDVGPAPNGLGPGTVADLRGLIETLAAAVDREHERAGHREAVIDRLHQDNQQLRRGELQTLFDPVRAALYRLHDMVRRESARWNSDQPPDPRHAGPLLSAIADEIAEAIGRTGAERFTVKPGEPFDPARHRPVAAEQVTDPELDGTVVEVLADGFETADGEQALRRAEVRVGRLDADAPRTAKSGKHAAR
jgi:molecular chaperone GrpE